MCVMPLCEHFIDLYLALVASRLERARPERSTCSSGSADISIWTESQAPTYRPNRFRDTCPEKNQGKEQNSGKAAWVCED